MGEDFLFRLRIRRGGQRYLNQEQKKCITNLKIDKLLFFCGLFEFDKSYRFCNIKSKSEIININKKLFFPPLNPMDINIKLAKKKLKWEPKIDLKEGIKMTVNKACY